MKLLNIIAGTAVAGLTLLGVSMATTNPSQAAYEEYATQRLTQYLKDNVCDKSQSFLDKGFLDNLLGKIDSQCDKLLDSANPQVQEIISKTTQRQNFIIFSIYHTNLKLESFSLIPGYKFESVGAFNNFYIYKAQKE